MHKGFSKFLDEEDITMQQNGDRYDSFDVIENYTDEEDSTIPQVGSRSVSFDDIPRYESFDDISNYSDEEDSTIPQTGSRTYHLMIYQHSTTIILMIRCHQDLLFQMSHHHHHPHPQDFVGMTKDLAAIIIGEPISIYQILVFKYFTM